MADYTFQKQIARALQSQPPVAAMAVPVMAAPKLPIPFPVPLAPKPAPISPVPSPARRVAQG